MSIIFKENTANAEQFFAILPPDWQEGIVPFWENYKNTTKIFVLEENNHIIGGGMVFSTLSPDLKGAPEIAEKYYQKGLLYLAFIWIKETHRGKGLGSFWLKQLKQQSPRQGYWLTIEDLNLSRFYTTLGFKLGDRYLNNENEEWVIELSY